MTIDSGAAMTMSRIASSATLVAAMAFFLPACLLVRTTEHHIKLNKNGSGEGVMRLIDIRSDGRTDSLVARDYAVMMASIEKEGVVEFEKGGRKVTSKQFFAAGDTLSAEISYTFPNLSQVEGLKLRKDEMFVVVNKGREIIRTNGSVESWVKKTSADCLAPGRHATHVRDKRSGAPSERVSRPPVPAVRV